VPLPLSQGSHEPAPLGHSSVDVLLRWLASFLRPGGLTLAP
jgi:hypothetical protein